MKTKKLYTTKAEIMHLEAIKKKFNLKDNALTGHIREKRYKKRTIRYKFENGSKYH